VLANAEVIEMSDRQLFFASTLIYIALNAVIFCSQSIFGVA
jgi:hypothetical protein